MLSSNIKKKCSTLKAVGQDSMMQFMMSKSKCTCTSLTAQLINN